MAGKRKMVKGVPPMVAEIIPLTGKHKGKKLKLNFAELLYLMRQPVVTNYPATNRGESQLDHDIEKGFINQENIKKVLKETLAAGVKGFNPDNNHGFKFPWYTESAPTQISGRPIAYNDMGIVIGGHERLTLEKMELMVEKVKAEKAKAKKKKK